MNLCCVCDRNLAKCMTIWAAEGALYCSKECGIYDFGFVYGGNAKEKFEDTSEEITPDEVGIEQEDKYAKTNTYIS